MKRNFDNFIATLTDDETQVYIFSETWTSTENEALFKLPGFTAFFNSNMTYRAGGVAIFVRDNLVPTEISVEKLLHCDCCAV